MFPKIQQSDLDKIKYATIYFAMDLFSPHDKDYVVLTIPDEYTNNPYLINDGSEAVDKTIERADKRTLFSTLWIKYRRSSFDRRAFYDEYVKKDMFDYYQDYNDPFYKNFDKEPDADKYFERWATRGRTQENPWFINRAGESHWIKFKALYPDFLGVTPKTAKKFRQDDDVIINPTVIEKA